MRKAQLNRRRKNDWLDAAAICELLRRGEGSPSHLDDSGASTLRVLWSGRKDLVDARSGMRHQAHALTDCLWPGLSAKDGSAGLRPLLRGLFGIKAGRVIVELLADGWTLPTSPAAMSTPCDGCSRLAAAGWCDRTRSGSSAAPVRRSRLTPRRRGRR